MHLEESFGRCTKWRSCKRQQYLATIAGGFGDHSSDIGGGGTLAGGKDGAIVGDGDDALAGEGDGAMDGGVEDGVRVTLITLSFFNLIIENLFDYVFFGHVLDFYFFYCA
jgi:hypothetical protein